MVSHFGLTSTPSSTYDICNCQLCGPSYRFGIDLLVPDTMEIMFKNLVSSKTFAFPRPNRVFFSGRPTGKWRSILFERYSNIPGWNIINGHVDLYKKMTTSVFCLDLGAAGFSTRYTLAIVLGCIPVYLDELKQPWEDVLPIQKFSIKIPIDVFENNQLVPFINNITAEKIKIMQTAQKHFRNYYIWNFVSEMKYEKDAYYLLKLLLLRYLNDNNEAPQLGS